MLAESGKNPSQVSWLNLKICHKHDNVFDVVGSRLVSIQAGDITDGFPVKENESCSCSNRHNIERAKYLDACPSWP